MWKKFYYKSPMTLTVDLWYTKVGFNDNSFAEVNVLESVLYTVVSESIVFKYMWLEMGSGIRADDVIETFCVSPF